MGFSRFWDSPWKKSYVEQSVASFTDQREYYIILLLTKGAQKFVCKKICMWHFPATRPLSATLRWEVLVQTNSTKVVHTNSTKVVHTNSTNGLHMNSTKVLHTNSTQVGHMNSTKVVHMNSVQYMCLRCSTQ